MKIPIHPYSVYTTKEAAQLLSVDPITVQRYIRTGKLGATRLGKVYRITGQALLDLMSLDQESIKFAQDRVRKVENAKYIQSKAFLLTDPRGQKYIELFNITTDSLLASLNPDHVENDEDQLTLRYIGSRIFNTAMAAYRDALSGYYQVSISNQRDLIETQFLTDFFRSFPEKIKEWRAAENKTRRQFSPVELRKKLDERDDFKDKKREARYRQFSEYATHITYSGFQLLANTDKKIEIGPFYDEFKLINTFHDLCLNFGAVVISLQANLKIKDGKTAALWVQQMETFDTVLGFKITESETFKIAKKNLLEAVKKLQLIQEKREQTK